VRKEHSKPCQIDVQKSNLSTFYQFMVFARLLWEQLEIEVSSRTLWEAKARKFNGQFGLWRSLYTRSRESILKPGASQLVYRTALDTQSVAGHDAFELVLFGRKRRMPHALSRARYPVCKRSSRLMSSKREGIVRPIVSLTRSPCT
jgi:hypothetical protein